MCWSHDLPRDCKKRGVDQMLHTAEILLLVWVAPTHNRAPKMANKTRIPVTNHSMKTQYYSITMLSIGTCSDHAVGLIFGIKCYSVLWVCKFLFRFDATNSSGYHSCSTESNGSACLDAVKQAITSPLFWPVCIYREIDARNALLHSVDRNN